MKKTVKKKEPVPSLSCTKKADKGCNNGMYKVTIPLKYMVAAYEKPAAFFEFRFVGMLEEFK